MVSWISILAIVLAVVVGLSLLLSTALTGVPTLSSSKKEERDVVELLKQAQLPRHARIVDLGSGWGSLVVALARAFPDATVHGVEMSPFPYLVSRLRTLGMARVSLQWANFFRCDLADADAVTCYLMPELMLPVGEWLDRTLKPGTPVVCNTFLFHGRRISAASQGSLRGSVALFIWPAHRWPDDAAAYSFR